MTMTSGIIILARMGSTRLPGKVLHPLCGVPVLEHMARRLAPVPTDRGVVVATTAAPADDAVEACCRRLGLGCFRGDEENVLQRCIDAAERFGMEAVVRLGGDSPLCDHREIASLLRCFLELRAAGRDVDYVSNTMDRRLPLGLDAEVYHIETFRRIARAIQTLDEDQRRLNEANVVPYLHTHPEEFDLFQPETGQEQDLSWHRWTLDTPEDLELIRRVYEALWPAMPDFGMAEVLRLLEAHPDWSRLNAAVRPVSGFWTPQERDKYRQRHQRSAPGEASQP